MPSSAENNKRIAKNTLYLYLRQLLVLAISLYTSRVVLAVLGVDDFGIYNVVGGVVAMFTIVTASLSQAISRYLTFELGKGDMSRLRTIFSTSVNIQILMSLIVLVLMECVGLWFLNNKMNIAGERMAAANWVFQISMMTFIVNLISVPYNAAIIAHEKMKAFAYVGILESSLKLVIVACLLVSPFDKLVIYAILQFCVSLTIRFVYSRYCHKHFGECRYAPVIDKSLLKEMSSFAGWNAMASTAWIFNTQGINILLNMFFGVAVNAARGISSQVESVIKGFVLNFTTAVRPQIIKSYSSGDKQYLFKLMCSSTKFSFYLMLVFALPFFFEADSILGLWLGKYPDFAASFVKLTLLLTSISILGDLLYTNILAIGQLKKYMVAESCLTVLVFPVSYFLFRGDFPPETPYIIMSITYFILIFVRLFFLKGKEGFPVKMFLRQVLLPAFSTLALAVVFSYASKVYFSGDQGFLSLVLAVVYIEICLAASIVLLGVTSNERRFLLKKANQIMRRK